MHSLLIIHMVHFFFFFFTLIIYLLRQPRDTEQSENSIFPYTKSYIYIKAPPCIMTLILFSLNKICCLLVTLLGRSFKGVLPV